MWSRHQPKHLVNGRVSLKTYKQSASMLRGLIAKFERTGSVADDKLNQINIPLITLIYFEIELIKKSCL